MLAFPSIEDDENPPGCPIECLPLYTAEELLNWSDRNCLPGVVLEAHHFFSGPKVIVCHDMKGGYLEDRHVHGSPNFKAYRFFHWPLIDMFVYFSHHLVTIPPKPWIDVAHRNGVPVLGTFIVENPEPLKTLFNAPETIYMAAKQLTRIARTIGFEGWLLNIEIELNEELIFKLKHFMLWLRVLNTKSTIIWYDSVTHPSGKLKWQNELNSANAIFAEICDSIYLNYCWTDANLQNTCELARCMKLGDVFVGVDVFGRKMFGGGKMNTCAAISKIRSYGLSIAIFAPGWVHEVLGEDDFTANNIRFWESLNLPLRHVPKQLPFVSTFCQGFGRYFFRSGEVISKRAWFNLSKAEPISHIYIRNGVYLMDSFEGGSCLKMTNFDDPIVNCFFETTGIVFVELTLKICSSKKTQIGLIFSYEELNDTIKDHRMVEEKNGWLRLTYKVAPHGTIKKIYITHFEGPHNHDIKPKSDSAETGNESDDGIEILIGKILIYSLMKSDNKSVTQ